MTEPDPNLAETVKARDLPRYYATLFAPAARRDDLMALYAFAAEAEKVAELVSEPALGEIRLTWWRDALGAALAGEKSGVPIIDRLAPALAARRLSGEALAALTEARQADLYADPPEDFPELEGRLGETQSSLFQLAGLLLEGEAASLSEAAGHAGIAYGIAIGLWRFAQERARGRLILPLQVLKEAGLDAETAYAAEPARLAEPLAATAAFAQGHQQKAVRALAGVKGDARAAFLPLAAAAPMLHRLRRHPARFVAGAPRTPALTMLSRIALAAARGGPR
ncbi:phytoene/squalene synthase family protein [Afifella pfennigii]|uniref:phytoene/squalene synthase family protein n=1 Tax=Afifella pfennigii TaxID=209897 RepID=UPI00068B49AF|nr:squalene/phytoene synthase family protein [Afifella pfennigii]